ncbi:UxaA family hydrolase [Ammoniphilus sp. 3BR4]|uniref:UxaA family hydrolase n=1 Tax=Ammoniphilus sp. 3BR4 TaxID=3158265 RepID=UPI003467893F
MTEHRLTGPNAIRLDDRDNVAVALRDVQKGEFIVLVTGIVDQLRAEGDIPYGHKVALEFIPHGGAILKYGECMGVATEDIISGQHVHVPNVRGLNVEERDNFQFVKAVKGYGNI